MIIHVSGKAVKEAFSDIAPLIKKSEMSKSIAIGYHNNKLFITTDTSMRYQKEIDIIDAIDPVNMSMTVWFKDLSEFIGSRETVTITFSAFTVSLETAEFSTQLSVSGAVINMIENNNQQSTQIDALNLQYAVSKLSSTSPISKVLQTTRPILFDNEYAYLKFNTIWFRCRSSGLSSILPIEDTKTILNFQPTSITVGDCLTFFKEGAMLVVPNSSTPHETQFEEYERQMLPVVNLDITGLSGIIQKLIRITGSNRVKVYLYDSGIELRVETPDSIVDKKVRVSGQILTSFEVPIEYLHVTIGMFWDDVIEIKRKDNLICMRTEEICTIMSVL